MVSLPAGAASAKKAIQNNLELLQGYEEVILFFDNDEPGRKAAKECADILPPGKVSIASLASYKDASEALQKNDQDAPFEQSGMPSPPTRRDRRSTITPFSYYSTTTTKRL